MECFHDCFYNKFDAIFYITAKNFFISIYFLFCNKLTHTETIPTDTHTYIHTKNDVVKDKYTDIKRGATCFAATLPGKL